jgi:hypothetical protein
MLRMTNAVSARGYNGEYYHIGIVGCKGCPALPALKFGYSFLDSGGSGLL